MTKSLNIFIILMLFFCTNLHGNNNKNMSIIEGKWENENNIKELKLYSINNGKMEELASSPINKGDFKFIFSPENEGFYAIAQNEKILMYRYIFYFKPGDKLCLEINNNQFKLIGNNTEENKAIEQWHNFIYPIESKIIYQNLYIKSKIQELRPQLENMLNEFKSLPQTQTSNHKFNTLFDDFKIYNMIEIVINYIQSYQKESSQSYHNMDFYNTFNIQKLTKSTSILNYPNALDFIKRWCRLYIEPKVSQNMIAINNIIIEKGLISNDTIIGEIILDASKTIMTYPGIKQYQQTYGKWLKTEKQKNHFNNIIAKYEKEPKQVNATDFQFEDINGKQIALSDFKGKVIYVDVWATWCIPCKMQIPYMIELEKEYHNNPNITFISVSINARKDYEK